MFDFSLFTPLLFAAAGVFSLALLSGETLMIEPILVASNLESTGLSSTIVTRQLTDEIRELNDLAGSELESVDLGGRGLEHAVGGVEGYYGLQPLVLGARNLIGLLPYSVDGELTGEAAHVTMTVRVYFALDDKPVDLHQVSGTADGLHDVIHEAALSVVEEVNPYIVALYWRRVEAAERNFAFPRTQAVIDRFLDTQPQDRHYLAYGLLGRMYMLKAEHEGVAAEVQRQDYEQAATYLEAALTQQPDFLFANVNLGITHARLGEYDDADGYFARAVEIDPNYLPARISWAEALEKEGRVRDAAFQWVAAVELDRDDPTLREELAEAYLILGMIDEARAQIDRAAVLDPVNATSYQRHLEELTGTTE